jgi:hypothetical protein
MRRSMRHTSEHVEELSVGEGKRYEMSEIFEQKF